MAFLHVLRLPFRPRMPIIMKTGGSFYVAECFLCDGLPCDVIYSVKKHDLDNEQGGQRRK